MKKRMLCLLPVLLAAGALLYAWRIHRAKEPAPLEPVSGRDFMCAALTYDEGTRTLRGTQTLRAQNRTGEALEEIVLRLYMNGMDGASTAVSGVTVNGEAASFEQDQEDPTVLTIRHPWQTGEEIELKWTVLLRHERTDGAAVVTLPSLAMRENGAWRTDAYDGLVEPSYGEAFDVVITLDGKVAAQMRMARDASFALAEKEAEKEILGVRVHALGRDAGEARRLLGAVQAALESLNKAGFAYPFDVLTVAQRSGQDALSLSGLIALDADLDGEQLHRETARLLARQIFGVFVESDPWNAPWLSHTLASCAEMLSYRARKGAAAYEERLYGEMELAGRVTRPAGVCVGASTAHFGSRQEMEQVLCEQGAAMLLGVCEAVGAEAFVTALTLYTEQNAGKTGTLEALEDALEQATGSRWDAYLADGLSF